MKHALLFSAVCCVLAGCSGVGSVYPIYTPEETVALSGVVGTWTPKDKEARVVISPGEQGSFKMRFREDDGTLNTFDIHLTKIGGALFADMCMEGGPKDAPLSMPVHLFAKVELKDSTLKLFLPQAKWFQARLDRRPSAVHHLRMYGSDGEGWIYLSDGTLRVRSFLKKCARVPEAFSLDEDLTLTKVSDSQELPPEAPALELK